MTTSGKIGVDAAFTRKADWSTMDWHACTCVVRKLQARIAKALGAANPFDASYEEYFEKRDATKMANRLSSRRMLLAIWQRQAGRCPVCGERITTETGWDLHHIVRRVDGGSNNSENLCLLHPVCHRQGHSSDFKFVLPVGLKT